MVSQTQKQTQTLNVNEPLNMVPTQTGKWGEHFPVREKSGNFTQNTGKIKKLYRKIEKKNTGKLRKFVSQ